MLTIRLQRTGTKNKSSFRIVLAQSYRSASKQVLEVLGHYSPRTKAFGLKSEDRLKHWLAQHVQVSPTVYNLLVEKKMIDGKKVKAWQPKKKTTEPVAATVPTPAVQAPAPVVEPAA